MLYSKAMRPEKKMTVGKALKAKIYPKLTAGSLPGIGTTLLPKTNLAPASAAVNTPSSKPVNHSRAMRVGGNRNTKNPKTNCRPMPQMMTRQGIY